MRDVRQLAEIRHVVLRVAHRFQIHQPRVLVHEFVDLFGMVGVEEAHFDAQPLERLGEERPGAAVKAGRGEKFCPAWTMVRIAAVMAAWPVAKASAADAAVERRQALLQHVVGGVHQPRVDVAEFLQTEQIGGVLGALEHVARCGVDGNRARRGGGVGLLSGVEGQRSEAGFLFRCCHIFPFFSADLGTQRTSASPGNPKLDILHRVYLY